MMNWFNILKAGSCYRTAYTYVSNEYVKDRKTKVLLIHANVVGDGGNVIGHQYGHAFVLDGDTVIDTEANIKMPYEKYVDLGNVTDEIIYTALEAMQYALGSKHYGPWTSEFVPADVLEEIKLDIEWTKEQGGV
tara:strand:+ start:81 stop:482 length:402 start_codon:yes stop_codon:yes gene_type:complete